MSNKSNSDLAWVFAAIGLAGTGFAAGFHRLVWLLFLVLTILWLALFYHMAQSEHVASLSLAARGIHSNDDQTIYWIFGIGAPIIVAIILRMVEGFVFALFGGQKRDEANSAFERDGNLPPK